jgi:hypothetical protein
MLNVRRMHRVISKGDFGSHKVFNITEKKIHFLHGIQLTENYFQPMITPFKNRTIANHHRHERRISRLVAYL